MFLQFLCLFGMSIAVPMRLPRKAGFGSKSEEMMQYGQYAYMNSPAMNPFYGYGSSYPQVFQQQPVWPQQQLYLWQQQKPVQPPAIQPQQKPRQAQRSPQPSKPQPQPQPRPQPQLQPSQQPAKPKPQKPQKPPPPTQPAHPSRPQPPAQPRNEEKQLSPQVYFPYSNAHFPYQQQPWHIPQIYNQGGFLPQLNPQHRQMPPGFGQPPISNEEGGNPYYGYFFQGLGQRPPYYSEEMFEHEYDKPKPEKEAPKEESPAAAPVPNATVPVVSTTTPSPPSQGGDQGGNASHPGVSAAGSGTPSQNSENKPAVENGTTPSPTVNISSPQQPGSEGVPQNGSEQPNAGRNTPTLDIIQRFPANRQQMFGHGSFGRREYSQGYRSSLDQGAARNRASAFMVNPSTPSENSLYRKGPPDNSLIQANRRGNLQSKPSNYPALNPRHGPSGPELQQPGKRPAGQRQRPHFPDTHPLSQWQNAPSYSNNRAGYKQGIILPDSKPPAPTFNTIGTNEHTHHPQEDANRIPASGLQLTSQPTPKGVFLDARRHPSTPETSQRDWEKQAVNPSYPEREHFPLSGSKTWRHQQNSPPFEAGQHESSTYPPGALFGQRGSVSYPEYNSFNQKGIPHFSQDSAWENSPVSPAGQRGSHLYPPDASQREGNPHYENDPFDQLGPDSYPRQRIWDQEQPLPEAEGSPAGQYGNPQYPPNNPAEQEVYFQYSKDQGRYFPYDEISPWAPEDNYPLYKVEPPRQTENIPYHLKRESGPRGSIPWDQETNPLLQNFNPPPQPGRSQFLTRSPRDPEMGSPAQTERTPYSKGYPPNFRGITAFPSSSRLCCAGNSPVPKEDPLASLDYSLQLRPSTWEHKPPEGSHSKHARHVTYPVAIHSGQKNCSLRLEKSPEENAENFEDGTRDQERDMPCSKNVLGQNKKQGSPQKGPDPTRNPLYFESNTRGDGNSVFAQIFGVNQYNGRDTGPDPENHMAGPHDIPEEGTLPEGIRSATLGSKADMKEVAHEFKRIPCFGSWLRQHLSSTGVPPGVRKQESVYGDQLPVIPTRKPNLQLETEAKIPSAEPPNGVSSLTGGMANDSEERRPDCLLLQN
ncbi:PREDICTED: enamelin isoform X1 [Gavialis gangeticus]|nr:PREDICTED: enamelin isoform X1 [Gavialis gangeticus]XP_019372658.1 PREDICTED: enamelin isoform X1 [Gavialis gangeticus]